MSRFRLIALLVIAVLRPMYGEAPALPPAEKEALLYFQQYDFASPRLSPDGRNLAFIARQNGHACLFRLDRSAGRIEGVFNPGEGHVETVRWLDNQNLLFSGIGSDGRQFFRLELGKTQPSELKNLHSASLRVLKFHAAHDGHVLTWPVWAGARVEDLNLYTGRGRFIESYSPEFFTSILSPTGNVLLQAYAYSTRWCIEWRASPAAPWQEVRGSDIEALPFFPLHDGPDERHALVVALDRGDTRTPMLLDFTTGERTELWRRADRDLANVIPGPDDVGCIGVEFFHYGDEDHEFFAESDRRLYASLDRSMPGMRHRVVSRTDDGQSLVIEAWAPRCPSQFFILDRSKGTLGTLGSALPDLKQGRLGKVSFFDYKTRDGVLEHGFVLLPPHADGHPVPLIVTPLAAVGVWADDGARYYSDEQYLAARGYAVAHFGVRGMRGFGRAFLKAGDFQLGQRPIEDLEDGIAALAQRRLIDPQRVAIYGDGSNEGLMALYTASVSRIFRAIVAKDASVNMTANDIGWMTSDLGPTYDIVAKYGGTKASYALAHRFEPSSFLGGLAGRTLIVYTSWYGSESNVTSAGVIRRQLDSKQKTYEWYEYDFKGFEHHQFAEYQSRLYVHIADFLDQALK